MKKILTVSLLIALAVNFIWSAWIVFVWAFHVESGLYFDDARLNAIIVLTGLIAPCWITALQFAIWPKTKAFQFFNHVFCLFSTFVAIVVGIGVADIIQSGADLGCEKIATANLSRFHRICCYRLNGGATTDYGVKVCDEWTALGIKWSHTIKSEYHCDNAVIQILGRNRTHVILRSTVGAGFEPPN